MNRLKSQLQFFHVLKNAKLKSRGALFASASDDLVKAIVDCTINKLNVNHKLIKEEKSKLTKYKTRLRALVNPKLVLNVNVKF